MNYLKISMNIIMFFVATLLLSSCDAKYSGLDFEIDSNPPMNVTVTNSKISLTSGTAIIVTVAPNSSNNTDFPSDAIVEFESKDETIFKVKEASEDNQFAMIGVSDGETTVKVLVDGEKLGTINVVVLPFEGGPAAQF